MLPAIQGLRYIPGYLDQTTHDALMAWGGRHPWQWTADHRFQVYGYQYHHPTRSVVSIGELPLWAGDVATRLWRDGLVPAVPNQMVVNEYEPGQGFFAHVDQAAWGEVVASVSLGSTCAMQLSRSDDERAEEVFLEPRSVLVLFGEARWAWRHAILPRSVDTWQGQKRPRSRRVSLTFRIIPESCNAGDGAAPQPIVD